MPILDGRDEAAIAAAAGRLAAGGLVAFATETVYGLGARADDDAAVAAIFAAKGRPADHPLIVHVATLEDARRFGEIVHPGALALAERFWPGPLTLIVPRRPGVAAAAAGGQDSIGLRMPGHPVAQALLQAAAARGVHGVAAPSANRFGRVSPTRAAHVADEFGPELMVLDGGDCALGIESAIVDCTRAVPALLRPGVLDREAIEAVLGSALRAAGGDAPRASGTLASHYAPSARLRLMDAAQLRQALELLQGAPVPQGLAVYSRTVGRAPTGIPLQRMPDDPGAAARELFAVLRGFDARGVRLVWVEAPPPGPAWEGVRDRLTRAAAD
ncbi:MAG: threonylcarbamoyl-AMP synthase [Burkholderiales bacterium]|nr:threonylcarbamoyl-AMP synthase [Burkholderiales bacterium]